MAERTIVTWQHTYSVGIKLIDEQHMELINLTNRLFKSCMAGKEQSNKAFLDIIPEAVDYINYHFGTEEKVMERVYYPDYARHKKEHELFVREVFSKVEDFNSGKILTPLSFVYFLKDWVLHHIAVSDKKVGEHLLAMSRSGELHRITVQVRKDPTTDRFQFR